MAIQVDADPLQALELVADRLGLALHPLGPGQRLLIYSRNGGYKYYEVQDWAGGRISREDALKLMEVKT